MTATHRVGSGGETCDCARGLDRTRGTKLATTAALDHPSLRYDRPGSVVQMSEEGADRGCCLHSSRQSAPLPPDRPDQLIAPVYGDQEILVRLLDAVDEQRFDIRHQRGE